jgi:hypothetical protein
MVLMEKLIASNLAESAIQKSGNQIQLRYPLNVKGILAPAGYASEPKTSCRLPISMLHVVTQNDHTTL